MGNTRFQCPHCGPDVVIEFTFPEDRQVFEQVGVVIRCPVCRKPFWMLGVSGIATPFIVPLDTAEMKGPLVDQLLHMAIQLEKTVMAKRVPIQDLRSADVSDTEVPVRVGGQESETVSDDTETDDDAAYQADFDCPKCATKYTVVGDEAPPEYIRLDKRIPCRKCKEILPVLWARVGETNYYRPLPDHEATSQQLSARPINDHDVSLFAALLETIGDAQDISEI